jgi:membrane protein
MDALTGRTRLARAFRFVEAFLRDLSETRTTGMAAEMAFWVFLSLVPLAAVAGLVIAKIALSSAEVSSLLASLPPQMRQLIQTQLTEVAAWNGGSVGAPAAVVFVWLASGGVHAVFELLELKAGVRRPWWRRRLIAIVTCAGLSLGTAVIAVLFAGVSRILGLVRGIFPLAGLEREGGWLDSGVRFAFGIAAAVGLVAGLYWAAVPRGARRRFLVWPGAVLAVGLQALLGYGYVFYLSEVGVRSAYQAGLSIVGVTLMALYLFALALLVGAEFNHVLSRDDTRDQPERYSLPLRERAAPSRKPIGTGDGPGDDRSSRGAPVDATAGRQPSSRMPPTAR